MDRNIEYNQNIKEALKFDEGVEHMLGYILGGIFVTALGIFIFRRPDLVWKLTEEWKSYYADEPSDLYLKSTKFGGALFTLFGIIMLILPLILE